MDPIIDSWPTLNKYPITDNITIPKMDNIVQKYALPEDTTGFIRGLIEDNGIGEKMEKWGLDGRVMVEIGS